MSATPGIVGSEREVHPRGGRPFRCHVEAIEPPWRMRMRYGIGFVTGAGEWQLATAPAGTRVSYDIDVHAHGWLVALLGRVLPFGRIHSRAMKDILESLEQETRRRAQFEH